MSSLVYRWTRPELSSSGLAFLAACLESGQWSYGPVARGVEREIARRTNTPKALLVNTGTSALWLLLAMAKTDKPQAIILPAFGYSAAASLAATLGYHIYVADTMPDAPVIDPASAARLIDDKVAVVLGINYFGYSVDWDAMPRSSRYQLIEDAAGSFGAGYKGKPAGSLADAAIFSFHTSKAVAAGGEGGCIVGDAGLVDRACALARNGHARGYYYAEYLGMNMPMTDVAASVLKDTIARFDTLQTDRQEMAKKVEAILESAGLPSPAFNRSIGGRTQNYQTLAIFVKNRDLVLELMRLNGIEVRPCWPHLLTQQPAFQAAIKKQDGEVTHAQHFAQHILNIPIYPHATDAQLYRLKVTLSRLLAAGLLEQQEVKL